MTTGYVPLAEAKPTHGGKAAGLRWLIEHGYPVPAGVVVGAADAAGLEDWIAPGRRYAVRSSAPVEASDRHSFAGQLATVLDVSGIDAIRDAIAVVIASAHDGRLEPYLGHAAIDPAAVEMSVIVQEMVAARASGVAFSRNPLTGLADVVIEAVRGTGLELVSGKAAPERWVNHWGEWTQRPASSDVPVSLMDELAQRVAAVADEQARPIDVEWSWDGRELYLLQVRPMTAAKVPVYSNRISREFLPGVIPPLVWSVNVPLVNGAWLRLFTSVVGRLDLEPDDLARQFAYRAYFNMGAVGDIFEAMSMPRDLLEVLMGIEGGGARPTFRPRLSVMRHLPRMTRMAWRIARYHHELDRVIPAAEEELTAIESRDLPALSDEELLAQLQQLSELCGRIAFANILAPLLFNAYGSVLRRRLAKRGIDAHAIDFGAGQDGLEAYDPKPGLRRLSRELADLDEPTRERVLAGKLELLPTGAAFLERFGHISDSGNDFSHVPLSEDPARLTPLLARDEPDPKGAEEAESGLLPNLARLDRLIARRTSRYRFERERVSYTYTRSYGRFRPTVLEVAHRLMSRDLLDDVDDVFYLTRSEVEAGLAGIGADDLRGLATARRSDVERVAGLEMPEVIFGDEFEPSPPVAPSQRLVGIPSSRGIHRATARVVRGVGEAGRVEPGDVLVIPYSDVGWTPMLARAGAIVAESGGLLSHSSIVAREFGIPCVVSVAGATHIPDGAVVRVDGFTGEIQWEQEA
jgi:phosphohistidine swiveling domain-containing protein